MIIGYVTLRNTECRENGQLKLRETLILFGYFSNQQEGDKKAVLLPNEVLERRGQGVGGLVSESDTFFKALPSEFIKENA